MEKVRANADHQHGNFQRKGEGRGGGDEEGSDDVTDVGGRVGEGGSGLRAREKKERGRKLEMEVINDVKSGFNRFCGENGRIISPRKSAPRPLARSNTPKRGRLDGAKTRKRRRRAQSRQY